MPFQFQNTYNKLDGKLFSDAIPSTVSAPEIIIYNESLAREIGIKKSPPILDIISGNKIPDGTNTIAQAYAGHQFGHFNVLGDGRAHLLGEHITPSGHRFDIQLKGSGPSAYSRRGDGKATLSAMLREYLISEAMHHLGIPTSRSLAVVSSGEKVYRNPIQDGGILTRIAPSHIRVGTFEYVHYLQDKNLLKSFTNYTINRHYPELITHVNPPLAFLETVMQHQIELIVHWMRVGFIHGVMNTDNMFISGITADYGPCAFMNSYDLATVFSSIDTNGRYAYGNQPYIAQWNLASLASALLPIIDDDEQEAILQARAVIDQFPNQYEAAWLKMMCHKIGIKNPIPEDEELIKTLLLWMQKNKADYTNTFLAIQGDYKSAIYEEETFLAWLANWQLSIKNQDKSTTLELMRKSNPQYIPRNFIVEKVLSAASIENNLKPLNEFLQILKQPYSKQNTASEFQESGDDLEYKTYCGT
jgi:serine/tyrosine/threonine adenylyltransferase